MKKVAGILAFILLLNCTTLNVYALDEHNYEDLPEQIRCTCYIDEGVTASGAYVSPGTMAARSDLIGCVACVNAINSDGSVGEFIGYFEIKDTGYGIETGIGKSNLKPKKTLGSIENGTSVDIWQPTLHAAKEWIDTYGDYVYIKIIRCEG